MRAEICSVGFFGLCFFLFFENRTLKCKAGTAFLLSTATHLSGAPAFPPLRSDWPPRRADGENRNHLMEASGRACKTDALVFGGAKRRECTRRCGEALG